MWTASWESASATIVTPEVGEPENKAEFSACQNVFKEYGYQTVLKAFQDQYNAWK